MLLMLTINNTFSRRKRYRIYLRLYLPRPLYLTSPRAMSPHVLTSPRPSPRVPKSPRPHTRVPRSPSQFYTQPKQLVNTYIQELINRSLHMHCILESTFARIFLFLELPFLQETQFYRENLSQSSSLEEFPDLPAITVTFRRDHFM